MVGKLLHMLLNDEVDITDLKINQRAIEYSIDHRKTWKRLPCNEFIDFILASQSIGTTDGGTIDLSKIVTKDDLQVALSSYVKNTAIANFITNTDLTTILADYVKGTDIDARITALTSTYVTATQVQNLITAAGHLTAADIANFLTSDQIDAKIAAAIALITPTPSDPDAPVSGLTQAQVEALIAASGHLTAADITDFLTEAQIDAKIAALNHLTAADIANFLTESQIDTKIATAIANSGHLTSADIAGMLTAADLVGYVKTSDIANFVTGAQVDQKIANAGHLTSADLAGYVQSSDIANFVTGAQVDSKIAAAGHLTAADIADFLTESQIDSKISAAIAAAGTGAGLTEQEVKDLIAAAGHLTAADIANFLTSDQIDAKISTAIANSGHLTSADIASFITSDDIANFLTESQIDQKIADAFASSSSSMTVQQITQLVEDTVAAEMTGFITESQIDQKINDALSKVSGGVTPEYVNNAIETALQDITSAELSSPLSFNLYKIDGTPVPQSFAQGDTIESVLRTLVSGNKIMVYDPDVKIPASMIDNSGSTTPPSTGGEEGGIPADAQNYRYYGPVKEGVNISDPANVVVLNKLNDVSTNVFDWQGIILNEERMCYAYPSSLGSLTTITDPYGFSYMNSFKKTVVNINGTEFFVYCQETGSDILEEDGYFMKFNC